jgi:hypothetical protein
MIDGVVESRPRVGNSQGGWLGMRKDARITPFDRTRQVERDYGRAGLLRWTDIRQQQERARGGKRQQRRQSRLGGNASGFRLCLRPLGRGVAGNLAGGPAFSFLLGRLGGRVVGHRDRQGAAGHVIPSIGNFGQDRRAIVATPAVKLRSRKRSANRRGFASVGALPLVCRIRLVPAIAALRATRHLLQRRRLDVTPRGHKPRAACVPAGNSSARPCWSRRYAPGASWSRSDTRS